jgi:outer membrane murein-binding lipoprotein Lpp
MTPARRFLVLAAAIFVLVGTGLAAEAKPAKKKSLRAQLEALSSEVDALRAQLAVLESQVEFSARRDGSAPGGVSYPVPVTPPYWGDICGNPCSGDADADGVNDCEDPCPCDASGTDTDGDGALDCYDPCPDDATDACIDPCRQDSDGDGANDCEDPCPWDPAPPADGDEDGIFDCQDPCPDDATNLCFGPCPLDQDGDTLKDCIDPCPWGEGADRPCIYPLPPVMMTPAAP